MLPGQKGKSRRNSNVDKVESFKSVPDLKIRPRIIRNWHICRLLKAARDSFSHGKYYFCNEMNDMDHSSPRAPSWVYDPESGISDESYTGNGRRSPLLMTPEQPFEESQMSPGIEPSSPLFGQQPPTPEFSAWPDPQEKSPGSTEDEVFAPSQAYIPTSPLTPDNTPYDENHLPINFRTLGKRETKMSAESGIDVTVYSDCQLSQMFDEAEKDSPFLSLCRMNKDQQSVEAMDVTANGGGKGPMLPPPPTSRSQKCGIGSSTSRRSEKSPGVCESCSNASKHVNAPMALRHFRMR